MTVMSSLVCVRLSLTGLRKFDNFLRQTYANMTVILFSKIKSFLVSIVPENPDFVFASLKNCNIVFETLTVPLTTFQDNTLESMCIFGTNVLSGSRRGFIIMIKNWSLKFFKNLDNPLWSQDNLEIEWNAFRRKTSFDALESEKQKVECTISLTKDDPNQKTKNCGGKLIFSNNCIIKTESSISRL